MLHTVSSNVLLFDGQRKRRRETKSHQNPKFENLPLSNHPTKSNGLAQEYLTRKGEIEKDFDEIMKNPRFVDILKERQFEECKEKFWKFWEKKEEEIEKKKRVVQSKIEKKSFEDGFEES